MMVASVVSAKIRARPAVNMLSNATFLIAILLCEDAAMASVGV